MKDRSNQAKIVWAKQFVQKQHRVLATLFFTIAIGLIIPIGLAQTTTQVLCNDLFTQLEEADQRGGGYYVNADYSRLTIKQNGSNYGVYGSGTISLNSNESEFSGVVRTYFSDREWFKQDRYDEEELIWKRNGQVSTKLLTWGGGEAIVENVTCYKVDDAGNGLGYMTGVLRGNPITFSFTWYYFG